MNAIANTTLPFLAICLLWSSDAGEITGRVTLAGTAPSEVKVDLKSTSPFAAEYPNGLTTRHFQVSSNGGLQSVLVYVRGDFAGTTFAPPSTTPVLDHTNGLYQPYVLGIRAGQALRLQSSDVTMCTLTAFAKSNGMFALTSPFGDRSPPFNGGTTRTFTAPEVAVQFKDDVHPWNRAYVGVFAHPFFAVTDQQGRFTIGGVPSGSHTLEIYHPKSGKSAKPVVVGNGTLAVDFQVKAK